MLNPSLPPPVCVPDVVGVLHTLRLLFGRVKVGPSPLDRAQSSASQKGCAYTPLWGLHHVRVILADGWIRPGVILRSGVYESRLPVASVAPLVVSFALGLSPSLHEGGFAHR